MTRPFNTPAIGRGFNLLRRLYIDETRPDQAALKDWPQTFDPVLGKRRIQKNQIEARVAALDEPHQHAVRVALDEFDLFTTRQSSKRLGDIATGDSVTLNHHHPLGTARGRLQAQRTGARKQIQAPPALKRLSEPVEQRLADTIGCRPKARHHRYRERGALPLPADDPDTTGCNRLWA